jgi:hypothetical protein
MKYIVIVDGYRAAEQFFGVFNKMRVGCIHVKSKPYKEDGLFAHLTPDNYIEEIMDTDLEGIIRKLTPYTQGENEIVAAIGGIDGGTELADYIGDRLSLPRSNGLEKSRARRDKYEMVAELNRTDPTIKTVSHFKSNDLEAIYHFIDTLPPEKQYPIVLKPLDSGGTDNVFICRDSNEVRKAHARILGSDNVFEQQNHEALVQTYLDGPEFMVNGVSCNGEYVCTDIWKYVKTTNGNGRPLYDYEDALAIDESEQTSLVNYVRKVLAALNVRYGVTHVEVKLTPDGPYLVEMATRVCGCKKIALYDAVYGINPFEMTALAYLDAEAFHRKAHERNTLSLLQHARHVDLATSQEGIIEEVPLAEYTRKSSPQKLPSVFDFSFPEPGEKLVKTEDLLSTAGTIILVHEDPNQIKSDYQAIKNRLPFAFKVRNASLLAASLSTTIGCPDSLSTQANENAMPSLPVALL